MKNKLKEIVIAREALKQAKELRCTCSGFVLQYEGSCQCKAGQVIREREKQLRTIINSL